MRQEAVKGRGGVKDRQAGRWTDRQTYTCSLGTWEAKPG